MSRRYKLCALVLTLTVTAAALAASAFGGTQAKSPVYLAMISPLTGPVSFVGLDNAAAVRATVKEVNKTGGIAGHKLVVNIFDDGSNPSQGVIEMQKVVADPKYLGIIGSGFSSVAMAIEPLASQNEIPYISMAGAGAQVYPPKPYVYMTTATSRLFAYADAIQLRKQGIHKIALMADNGGYGLEGVADVEALAKGFGFQIVDKEIFPLTETSFTAELSRIKASGAQALWLWNATTLAVTITKEMHQLKLPQLLVLTGANTSNSYLQPACPDSNGALADSYLGPVAKFLPASNPSRPLALDLDNLLGHTGSTFNFDGDTAVQMFKQAMTIGGFTRSGINTALQQKMAGFVGPGGVYHYTATNHTGLFLRSMVVSKIVKCQLVPVQGQASLKPWKTH